MLTTKTRIDLITLERKGIGTLKREYLILTKGEKRSYGMVE